MTATLYVLAVALCAAWAAYRIMTLTGQRDAAYRQAELDAAALDGVRAERDCARAGWEQAMRAASREAVLRHTAEQRLKHHMEMCEPAQTPRRSLR